MILVRENKRDSVYRVSDEVLVYAKKMNLDIIRDNQIKIKHDDKKTLGILLSISNKVKDMKIDNIKNRRVVFDTETEQGSDEWLMDRMHFVTSTASRKTDASLDDHAFRLAVLEKFPIEEELLHEDRLTSKELMERGNEYEPLIRNMVNEQLNEDFTPIIAKKGVFLASLDGFNSSKDTILEIKTVKVIDFIRYKIDQDRAIEKYKSQLIQQQGVVGVRHTILALYSPIIDELLLVDFYATDDDIIALFDVENKIIEKKKEYINKLEGLFL